MRYNFVTLLIGYRNSAEHLARSTAIGKNGMIPAISMI